MLAFRALEKNEAGSYSEECELGADLELQFQNAVINIDRNLTAYLEGLAEGAARAARKQHG